MNDSVGDGLYRTHLWDVEETAEGQQVMVVEKLSRDSPLLT
jgi:hypothetical protein